MLRFDSDGSAVVVGGLGRLDAFTLGSHLHLEGDSVALRVFRTGRPARFDDYRVAAGPLAELRARAEEVGRLLPVGSATMGRFEPDGSITTVASWSTTEAAFPTGRRWPTEGTNVAWTVLQTGRSARLDDFSAATDPIGVTARDAGIKSAVGSPVVVKGHLWGVMTATSTEGRCRRAPSAPHFVHGARRDGDRERGKPVRARCLAPTHCRGIGRDSPEDRAPPGGSG